MMRQDRFTEQAQQVLAASQEIVRQQRNSQWGVPHVLGALVSLQGGLAEQVLQKLNVDMNRLRQRTLDLGFVYRAPEPEADLSSAVIFDEPLMLAMPKDDPLRKSRLIKPAEIYELRRQLH